MKKLFWIIVCLALNVGILFAAEIPAKPQDHPIALVGGTIHTVSGSVIENGTILFDKGKIIAIGTTIDFPAETEKIDVRGKHIYPGFVDARTNIGLTEIGAVRATNDIAEVGSINPNIRAEVAVNPESELIPVTRANGITTVITMPAGGTISGTAAAISMDGWTWDEMTLRAPVGMVLNWPSMIINKAWWEQRSEEDQKKARENALEEIQNAVADARAYLKAKRSETKENISRHKTDIRWDAMEPVLDGKIPVLVNADEIEQIQAAVAWGQREHLKIVILGGYDAWRVTDLLKANNVPVIVGPVHQLPWRSWEEYDAPFTLAKKLFDAGVKFCIAQDDGASNERNLPYNAATAASYGLPKEEALKSITLYPAQVMGIDDHVGSLDVGKDATMIVTTGDPLEITNNVAMEFIQGKNISLESRHTRLYEKYKERYRRLGIGEKKEGAGGKQ